ncbi:hypothetical protein [uncultured Algibacter sp.]|uniref:hypothetical protein n=1 Tax=uncultured Algibacter sp. TaxID=298659 RepID=UPI002621047B|nr:hypothetical protein [uncultured Algibacter sp.]
MKKSIILLGVLLLSFSNISAQETITNESVIQMQKLDFDDYMIIDKINSSDVKFDASIGELSKLKDAGVSSEVISLIMQKSKHNTKSKTGIYYITDNDDKKLIQPSVFSGSNSNAAAQKLVSGLINSKKKAQLPKTKSNNVIKAQNPEFLFVFDPSSGEVDNMQTNQGNQAGILNWWFRTATSPNEFVLVKLTVKERKNLREVVTGKSNWLGNSNGIDPKYALPFKIEVIEGNKFRVIPESLEPGEYCFIYQGQVPQGRDNQSVFDFSYQ